MALGTAIYGAILGVVFAAGVTVLMGSPVAAIQRFLGQKPRNPKVCYATSGRYTG